MLGEQEGSKTCVREKMKRMRIEHGWSESSALERILIERIVGTWLDLYFAELVCNQWKGGSIPEGKYKQHRIDRSHRRHLSAVMMLDVGDRPKNGIAVTFGHYRRNQCDPNSNQRIETTVRESI